MSLDDAEIARQKPVQRLFHRVLENPHETPSGLGDSLNAKQIHTCLI